MSDAENNENGEELENEATNTTRQQFEVKRDLAERRAAPREEASSVNALHEDAETETVKELREEREAEEEEREAQEEDENDEE